MKKGAVFGVVLITFLLLTSCFVAQDAANTVRGLSSKTLNADHVLDAYETFFNRYNDAKSKVVMYNREAEEISVLSGSALDDARVRHNGTFNYISDICSQYNSDSSKLNKKFFKDDNLPYQLQIEENGNKIVLKELY